MVGDFPSSLLKLLETYRRAPDAASASLQGQLKFLGVPDRQRVHLTKLLQWGKPPTRLVALVQQQYLDALSPEQWRALDTLMAALEALQGYWTPTWKNLVKHFGPDGTIGRIPDETIDRIFGAPPFRKYEKAMLKAIRAGLSGHPLVESWIGSRRVLGQRKVLKRAKMRLERGAMRPSRPPSGPDLELQTEILRLRGQGLSLREIHRRLQPQKSWEAFRRWCLRREIQGREMSGPHRRNPSSTRRRLPGRTTPASSPLSPPAEATPGSPPQPTQPFPGDLRSERPARLQPQSPAPPNPFLEPKSESRQYLPPHPLLLLLANPDGSLKPEFEDYQDDLALEPPDLVPVWWPRQDLESQEPLGPADRARDFHWNLEALLSPPDSKGSGSVPPTPPSSTPQRVLQSLLQLRSAVLPATIHTLD